MVIINKYKSLSYVRQMCISRKRMKPVVVMLIAVFALVTWTRTARSSNHPQEVVEQNKMPYIVHPDQTRDFVKSKQVHLSTKAEDTIVKGDTRPSNVASDVIPADGTLHVASECTVPVTQNTNNRRTAVIAISVVDGMSMDLAFTIPFIVAAWQRIGWSVTVFVVGDIDFWDSSAAFKLVKKTAYEIAHDVQFVTQSMNRNALFYARFLRIFAVLSTSWLEPEDFVLTSDADLLPLDQSIYDAVYTGDLVTIMNIECCGVFHWRKKTYRYLPIAQASIGMTSKVWKSVMHLNTMNQDSMLEYIDPWLRTNNDGIKVPGGRVNPIDMHMDETVVSKQIYKAQLKSNKVIRRVTSTKGKTLPANIMSYTDVRLALSTYTESSWERILQLSKMLFNKCVLDKITTFHVEIMKTIN